MSGYVDDANRTWRSKRTRDGMNRLLSEDPAQYVAVANASAGYRSTCRMVLQLLRARWTNVR